MGGYTDKLDASCVYPVLKKTKLQNHIIRQATQQKYRRKSKMNEGDSDYWKKMFRCTQGPCHASLSKEIPPLGQFYSLFSGFFKSPE